MSRGLRWAFWILYFTSSVTASQPLSDWQLGQELRIQTAPGFLTAEEEREVLQRLRETSEIPLQFNKPDGAGIEIINATLKASKRERRYYTTTEGASDYATDYVMQMQVTLHNNSAKMVTGIGLRFFGSQSQNVFFINRTNFKILPGEIYSLRINLMAISGNPSDLIVEVIRLGFADQSSWSEPLAAVRRVSSRQPHNPQVDRKPRPLNRMYPNYTELARINKVSGAARMFVSVGADGLVKKVEVVNALPDGLTEEAIKIARVLQFHPAMKDGVAVDYTVPLEIEFSLR